MLKLHAFWVRCVFTRGTLELHFKSMIPIPGGQIGGLYPGNNIVKMPCEKRSGAGSVFRQSKEMGSLE